MSQDPICPTCGQPLPPQKVLPDDGTATNGALGEVRTAEVIIPATSSGDEGESDEPINEPISAAHLAELEFGAPDPLDIPTSPDIPKAADTVSPVENLTDPQQAAPLHPVPPPTSSSSEEHERAGAGPGPGWPIVLLASYASLLTLSGAWLLASGRIGGEDDPESGAIPNDSRPDAGRRGGRSQRVAPVEALLADRLTTLKQPIRLGSLEITPLSVEAGPVSLVREPIGSSRQTRNGGRDALWLQLRLRNLSADAIFDPLDEAFVREPDRGLPASFLDLDAEARIYPYPLAVESEWSIVGQSFPTLRPGETAEVVIVSAPDAAIRAINPMTWRLRLRTGPDRVDEVGVRFDPGEIRRSGDPT